MTGMMFLINKIFPILLIWPATAFPQENNAADTSDYNQRGKGFITKSIMDDKNLNDSAKKFIQKAIDYISYGQANYYKGLEYYLSAYKLAPENAQLNAHIGYCYLKTGKKGNSIVYLQKAYTLNEHVDTKINLVLGQALQLNYDFDEAISHFREYLKNNRDTMLQKTVNKFIEECEDAKKLVKNPVRVFVDNAGDSINSEFSEYNPYVTADESQLFFTSRRDSTTGKKQSPFDYNYYEDIYVCNNINGKWSKPKNLGKPVNSPYNDAVIGIALDGQKIFIYRDQNGGDLFISELKGKLWKAPHRFNNRLNTPYHESSATYSVDQKSIFFVSDTPLDSNHIGGKDIYRIDLNDKGRWGKPSNMGPVINTPYNETSVFAHPDGHTLYFSSEGHHSMGGYDIFKTEFINGNWAKPENIGYPINTPDDDISFSLTANGKTGYYASSAIGGKGEKDIYMITFLGPEKEGVLNTEDNLLALRTKPVKEKVIEPKVTIREAQPTLVKGIISDAITKKPLEATIEIVDNEKNKIISTLSSNGESGKYLVSLPSGKNYGIAIKKKGYLFHSENFVIPASADYQVIHKDIDLKKLDVGSIIVLKNIFFDFNKADLRPESYPELGRIVRLLNEFGFVTIEISGHTDNVGSEEYNIKLSEARAKSVVDYLIGQGIFPERLSFAGYGFSKPVASNDSEEGRQMNRRTEFKVLRTDYKQPKDVKQPLSQITDVKNPAIQPDSTKTSDTEPK